MLRTSSQQDTTRTTSFGEKLGQNGNERNSGAIILLHLFLNRIGIAIGFRQGKMNLIISGSGCELTRLFLKGSEPDGFTNRISWQC